MQRMRCVSFRNHSQYIPSAFLRQNPPSRSKRNRFWSYAASCLILLAQRIRALCVAIVVACGLSISPQRQHTVKHAPAQSKLSCRAAAVPHVWKPWHTKSTITRVAEGSAWQSPNTKGPRQRLHANRLALRDEAHGFQWSALPDAEICRER